MKGLERRDYHPGMGFMSVPFPEGAPPLDPLAAGADGNAHTFFAWGRAECFRALLAAAFPDPPPGVLWGADVSEREIMMGDWPDGDIESAASVSVGVLFDPEDAAARAFAERVSAERPRAWGAADAAG